MADQPSDDRKLEVPVNDASMQLSVKPRHHLRDWDRSECEESYALRDSIWSRSQEFSIFLEFISECPFAVANRLSVSQDLRSKTLQISFKSTVYAESRYARMHL